jgi:hypothetical protein
LRSGAAGVGSAGVDVETTNPSTMTTNTMRLVMTRILRDATPPQHSDEKHQKVMHSVAK